MARIKIEDLPVLDELDAAQTKGIFGGYLKSPLKNASDTSDSSGEGVPTEAFMLNFEEIKVTYTEENPDTDPDGDMTWEISENK